MANTSYSPEALEAKAGDAEQRVKYHDKRIANLRREIEKMTREIAKVERYKAEDTAFAARMWKDATRNRKADAVLHDTLMTLAHA